MAGYVGRRQRRAKMLKNNSILRTRPTVWQRLRSSPKKIGELWASENLGIWLKASFGIVTQAGLPMFLYWCILHWQSLENAINNRSWWATWVFMGLYLIIIVIASLTAVAIKTALRRQAHGSRTALFFALSLGCYLFVFFMARGIQESVSKTSGDMQVLTIFFFGLYLLFLGWTTKPIWDRATDDWYRTYYKRRYGISPDDDKS